MLTGSGYHVISGRNGAEALEAVRARGGRVDLLLTDVVMPHMTGAELASALGGEQPGLKVLFMTGHTDDPSLAGRLGDGSVELIQKPFTNEALLRVVRRLLGPARAIA